MPLDREDVRRIARLAHLELDADQERAMARQLGRIIDAFSELERWDIAPPETSATPSTPGPGTGEPDNPPHHCLDQATVLANAPRVEGDHIAVPRVVHRTPAISDIRERAGVRGPETEDRP